jgi:hypothetical protein
VSQYRFLGVILSHLGSVALASALANSDPSPTPSVVIAPNGTVQVTRVVPVPSTISLEAQGMLAKIKPAPQSHQTLQERRDVMKVARYEVPGCQDKQVPSRRERYDWVR